MRFMVTFRSAPVRPVGGLGLLMVLRTISSAAPLAQRLRCATSTGPPHAGTHGRQTKRARSTFLSNLPTLVVRGMASITSMRSGTCHRANPARSRWRRTFVHGDLGTGLEHDAGQRALLPLGVGHGDHRRLGHRGHLHDGRLHVHRGDPLAAGLDEVLGAVGDDEVPARASGSPRRRCGTSRRR